MLLDEIKYVQLDPGVVLFSFDVVSLYTNVYVDESIEDAIGLLYNSNVQTKHAVREETYRVLAKLYTQNVLMQSMDGQFVQKEGFSMRSPAPPTLANIWMKILYKYLKSTSYKLYRRYVDDISLVVKEQQIDVLLDTINKFHKNLSFAVEEEESQG